jgi:hypothetical protein
MNRMILYEADDLSSRMVRISVGRTLTAPEQRERITRMRSAQIEKIITKEKFFFIILTFWYNSLNLRRVKGAL